MFALVTDSTSTLTIEEITSTQTSVVPLSILLNGKSYLENIDLTNKEFYETIQADLVETPKTSQPSPGNFVETFKKLQADGVKEVMAILISSGISGTINSVRAAAEQFSDMDIKIIDSLSLSRPVGDLVIAADKYRAQGLSLDETAEKLQNLIKTIKVYCLVGDLQFLHKGGRVSGMAYFLGSLLNINPIVRVNEQGVITAHEKVRSFKKAINRLTEYVEHAAKQSNEKLRVNIMYSTSIADAEIIAEKLKHINAADIKVNLFGLTPVIGSHTGAGSIGISIMSDYE